MEPKSRNRKLSNFIEEFIGQLFMWSFVVIVFVLLMRFFGTFVHPIIIFPICLVLSIPIGFLVVIGPVAIMNYFQKFFKKEPR
jgi:hypothetical protein